MRITVQIIIKSLGSTGSGKSTILDLIMYFYKPNKGTILLNGTDIQ
ncbi:ATP-binding cassette domain-containing protein [Bacillus thuringiensis]|nr:hypothetical protein C6A34_13755 [Bacillus thuringiensis]